MMICSDQERAITELTAELTALVDQLEADCATEGGITGRSASQLHQLRDRAERLFTNMT